MIGNAFIIHNDVFEVKKFLGKGKSGYSYLIENLKNHLEKYVLKKMHDEPCAYYRFGDKLQAEIHAYRTLANSGIRIPELLEYNDLDKYLIKEYIEGQTASSLVAENRVSNLLFRQLFDFAAIASRNGLNLDYFPTNFIFRNGILAYIDYELNSYTEEWNLPNWGIYYWLNSEGMNEYIMTHDLLALNTDLNSGKPIKTPYEKKAEELIKEFGRGY